VFVPDPRKVRHAFYRFFFFSLIAASAQVSILQDGTPVRLRLNSDISSATARANETVDFEVTEPVVSQNYVAIPKGSIALGRVTKAEAKRRFGRAGSLEISIDSVRLPNGQTIPLRATREKGAGDMSGSRVAATIAASPVLVWVKGKDVSFKKGTETTAYVSGDARVDESGTKAGSLAATDASANRTGAVLTNADIVRMVKAGLSDEITLNTIANSPANFDIAAQDLLKLKEAGVNDTIINAMVQKSRNR
jgi:hypothetical protein